MSLVEVFQETQLTSITLEQAQQFIGTDIITPDDLSPLNTNDPPALHPDRVHKTFLLDLAIQDQMEITGFVMYSSPLFALIIRTPIIQESPADNHRTLREIARKLNQRPIPWQPDQLAFS